MIGRILAVGVAVAVLEVLVAAAAEPTPAAVTAQITAGQQLFETTCASSTCHGSGGIGAQGPRLTERNLAFGVVRDAVVNGRAGTAMPAFKQVFDQTMTAEVIAYVLSISSGGRWSSLVTLDAAQDGQTLAAAKAQPVAIGSEKGSPAAGYAVFYDATQAHSCRTCHSYRQNGGPIGPDLAGLEKSTLEIFQILSRPGASNPAYPAVTVTLKNEARQNKARFSGIKRDETGTILRLVDATSLPPVTYSLLKSEIAAVVPADTAGFDHTALPYGKQDLLDAAAFLGRPAPQKETAPLR